MAAVVELSPELKFCVLFLCISVRLFAHAVSFFLKYKNTVTQISIAKKKHKVKWDLRFYIKLFSETTYVCKQDTPILSASWNN